MKNLKDKLLFKVRHDTHNQTKKQITKRGYCRIYEQVISGLADWRICRIIFLNMQTKINEES